MLGTHRGYDPGALTLARALARELAAPLVASTVSRLVVDLNRSVGHRSAFSEATRAAPAQVRAAILDRHYRPYRERVEELVARPLARGRRVIHISSHSFTPELDGHTRTADVGLLYDPARRNERVLCAHWEEALAAGAPGLRVRRNYPYTGKSDGLTSSLRRRFPQARYLGIELEVNQAIVFAGGTRWRALRRTLIDSLREASRRTGATGEK